MLSIVDRETPNRVVSIDDAPPAETPEEIPEFEIVLGRRQIASLAFVCTVVIVAFSAVAYLAGKSLVPKDPAPAPQPVAAAAPVVVQTSAPAVKTEPKPEPAASPAPVAAPEAPLFGDPKPGALYLQLGAVEKGVAVIMAEGLRKRGFAAFVGPGPNERVFRVLVGPLDADGFKRAKDSVDEIGLSTFARKYQQ